MNKKEKIGCGIVILRSFTTLPIWYYLFYQILIRVEATELMMFLFWVYVPFGITFTVVTDVIVRHMMED